MFPSTHGSSITVKVKKVKEYLKKNKIKSKIYTDIRIIDGEFHQFCFPAICDFLLFRSRSFGLEISGLRSFGYKIYVIR